MAGMLARLRSALSRVTPQQQSGRSMSRVMTPAGVPVDHDSALTFSAVWACVRVISETIGVLNMHVYQQQGKAGKRRRTDLRIDQMLRRAPNTNMTAMTLKQIMTAHVLTWGNGYAEIERDMAGRPTNLWPMLPDRTRPVHHEDGSLWYEHTAWGAGGERVYLPAADVFHLKGFGFDGLQGYDVISYAARSIGAAIAAETFGSSFFGNGTHLSGGLFHPKRLSKEARQGLREEFESTYRGPSKAFRMGVFEEGVEWKQFGLSPEASQFIETRQLSVEEVARWFRVPLHKIGHLLRATNNNIEHQGIEFVVDTILPIAVMWEQEADSKLLTTGLRGDHYFKLLVETLKRGDMKSRYEAYQIGRLNGWLNANQICEFEDLDPIGPAGDVYIVPLNYQNIDRLLDPPAPPPTAPPEAETEADSPEPEPPARAKRASRSALFDAATRGVRRYRAAMVEAKKNNTPTDAWMKTESAMLERLISDMTPPARVYGALLGIENEGRIDGVVRSLSASVIEKMRREILNTGDCAPYAGEAGINALTDSAIEIITSLRADNA